MEEKTKFQEECENAYTPEEAKQMLFERIEARYKQPQISEMSKFQKECETAISIEEARQHTLDFVRQLFKEKNRAENELGRSNI